MPNHHTYRFDRRKPENHHKHPHGHGPRPPYPPYPPVYPPRQGPPWWIWPVILGGNRR